MSSAADKAMQRYRLVVTKKPYKSAKGPPWSRAICMLEETPAQLLQMLKLRATRLGKPSFCFVSTNSGAVSTILTLGSRGGSLVALSLLCGSILFLKPWVV